MILTVEHNNTGPVWVSVAGNSNAYSVQGVPDH